MAKRQFKTESKRILDMMINSIYTHKEIFLRELISNASDAIDKLHYKSLSDSSLGVNKDDLKITVTIDRDARTVTVSDNGIGMTADEMEKNLGYIAHSGTLAFVKGRDPDWEMRPHSSLLLHLRPLWPMPSLQSSHLTSASPETCG